MCRKAEMLLGSTPHYKMFIMGEGAEKLTKFCLTAHNELFGVEEHKCHWVPPTIIIFVIMGKKSRKMGAQLVAVGWPFLSLQCR